MRIGFFDSGHGGLDILGRAMSVLEAQFYFVADERYHPYGAMAVPELIERCHLLTSELVEKQGCELVVVACNTATVYAIEELRTRFSVPFVGVEPYLNYINHAKADLLKKGSVGALVTPNTMRSERFVRLKKEKDPQDLVHVLALSELAPAIEAFVSHHDEKVFLEALNKMLEGHNFDPWQETILGCTHYPLVARHLEHALKTKCISPSEAIVKQIVRLLKVERLPAKEFDQLKFHYWNTQEGDWQNAALTDFLPLPGEVFP